LLQGGWLVTLYQTARQPCYNNYMNALLKYVLASVAVLLVSLALVGLRAYVGPDLSPSAPLLLLLAVFLLAIQLGIGPALLAALLAGLCYDFFFLLPYYTFTIARIEDASAFAVFFIVAVIASRLAAQVEGRARDAEERVRETSALNQLSRMLLERADPFDDEAARQVAVILVAQSASLYLTESSGDLRQVASFGPATPLVGLDSGQREVSVDASGRVAVVPLLASGLLGSLTVQRERAQPAFSGNDLRLVTTVAGLLAGGRLREQLASEAQEAALLREADAVKSSLLAAASHELRTPLAAIKGSASSLLAGGTAMSKADERELLEAIDSEADRLSRLVNNLLDLSRVEAGALHVESGLYSIAEVVNAAATGLGERLAVHPLTLDLPADLPLVPLDYVLIQQVISNLLDNAARYTPAGTPITVAARLESDDLLVSVEDAGPGLPAEELAHIFDRFYRVQSSKGGRQGMGIGLTLARGFVEAHDGRMWASNRPGGGLRVSFSLPLVGDPSPPEGEAGKGA